MARITKASLEEFAKEIAALEGESSILTNEEAERYVGGRYGAYDALGTLSRDREVHELAGLVPNELQSFDPNDLLHFYHPCGVKQPSPSKDKKTPPAFDADSGDPKYFDASGYVWDGSGYVYELGEVEVIAKGKKKPHDSGDDWSGGFHPSGGYEWEKPVVSPFMPGDGKQEKKESGGGSLVGRGSSSSDKKKQEEAHDEWSEFLDKVVKMGPVASAMDFATSIKNDLIELALDCDPGFRGNPEEYKGINRYLKISKTFGYALEGVGVFVAYVKYDRDPSWGNKIKLGVTIGVAVSSRFLAKHPVGIACLAVYSIVDMAGGIDAMCDAAGKQIEDYLKENQPQPPYKPDKK